MNETGNSISSDATGELNDVINLLKGFMENENQQIRAGNLSSVLRNRENREKLWEIYESSFEQAKATGYLMGPNKGLLMEKIQDLQKHTEENQHLLSGIIESCNRTLTRFAQKQSREKIFPGTLYSKNGRLSANKWPAQDSVCCAINHIS